MRSLIEDYEAKYPALAEYTDRVHPPERTILGREEEIRKLKAAMMRPELSNVILVGPAGVGKTAIVQGAMDANSKDTYLEVDLSRMISDNASSDVAARKIKQLFDEAETCANTEDIDLILFIDEAHQLVQISGAAVEAIKPVLARSGTRGLRIIMATTADEFDEWIRPNQALYERLQRIIVTPPVEEVVIEILKSMVTKYAVASQIHDDSLFHAIYDYTNRYQPASVQPRKSILVLDSMIGWHRLTGERLGVDLLAKVLNESQGINVAFRVDGDSIKSYLDSKVYDQEVATSIVADRMQLCVANLNDPNKPMASMLFTGSTGVGKFCTNSTPVPVYTEDGSVHFKAHGELRRGDKVFRRNGVVQDVLDVFPQGEQDVYRVYLEDGRHLDVGGPHLWGVYSEDMLGVNDAYELPGNKVMTTLELMNAQGPHYIPMNGAVQWPSSDLQGDLYKFGVKLAEKMCIEDDDIPHKYMTGSIMQRWLFVQGIFDAMGDLRTHDGSYEVSLRSSRRDFLLKIRDLLFSLGISTHPRECNGGVLELVVRTSRQMRAWLFRNHVNRDLLMDYAPKDYSFVDSGAVVRITEIEKLPYKEESSCIYVSGEEHLYQAGQFVVTHNTELVKQLSTVLFGDDVRSVIRFDMTEFAQDKSMDVFREEITRRIWERPFSIVLLDEIEKASPFVTRLLLQVLDDGRLTDANGRQVSFLNSYIVLTTNAGANIFENISKYDGNARMSDYQKLIRSNITNSTDGKFPPELLGRVDAIVPFAPLKANTKRRIVEAKLINLRSEVKRLHGVRVDYDERLLKHLLEDRDSFEASGGGARQVISVITSDVATEVARFVNRYPNRKHIYVYIDGKLASEDKFSRVSNARVAVSALQR